MIKAIGVILLISATTLFYLHIPAHCSEEDYLRWNSFNIECMQTPDAGKISCEAVKNEKKIVKFIIRAFSKEYILDNNQLSKLENYPLESLKITHEAGYIERGGGYTLHFRFYRSVFSAETKTHKNETICISVNAAGVTIN